MTLEATPLWEQVLTAVADSEDTWGWQPHDPQIGRCTSTELAVRCVERLRVAYVESRLLSNPDVVSIT